jgi:deazaflavin-dependent oxidoreductase (nitroreductase family)
MHTITLTTTGRRTGQPRTATLYAADDPDGAPGTLVVTGSRGGSPVDPRWAENLRADGRATVVQGGSERPVRAREVSGPDRDRLWAVVVEGFPTYASYQRNTARVIPLFVLEPDWG